MAKKKNDMWTHNLEISISTTKWFSTQKEIANFLGISNSSKKSIQKTCEDYNYKVNFNA